MSELPANIVDLNGQKVMEMPAPSPTQRAVLLPLRQPQTQEEAIALNQQLAALGRNAEADHHVVLNPTHLVVKAGKIAGYLSLGALPTVHCWFDSAQKHPWESLRMLEHGETVLRTQGVRQYAIACADESPFAPFLERLGFKKLGTTTLYQKEL